MSGVIGPLYGGEIYPAEQIVPKDPSYWPLCHKIEEERKALQKKLAPEDSARLEELHERYMQVCSIDCFASFSYGMKLGAKLLIELIGGGEEGE